MSKKKAIEKLEILKNPINSVDSAIDDNEPIQAEKVPQKPLKSKKIVLGVRNLSNKNVPLTSKVGNTFSRIYFKLLTGESLKDTQTGLRGIPREYFKFALSALFYAYAYTT
jgi:hypothetical protein